MQVRLRIRAAFRDEVAHAAEQAALWTVRWVFQITEIEIRTVIAGQRHAVRQVPRRLAQQLLNHPMQRHDAQPQIVDQPQVRRKCQQVVRGVFVAGNIDGVVGKDRYAHARILAMSGKDTSLTSNRRGRRWVWLAAAAALAVVLLVGWWLRASPDSIADLSNDRAGEVASHTVQSSAAEEVDLERAVLASADPSVGNSVSAATRRDSQGGPPIVDGAIPTADAIRILLPLAEAGRADAMREMANRLIRCRDRVDGDEASIRRNALSRFYVRNGREPQSDEELSEIAEQINYAAAMSDYCRGLDPALMASRVDWMERAAQGGDIGALLGYGGKVLNDMRDFDDLLINFDEVARRRQLARSFLHAALNRGACSALVMLSAAYSGQRNPYDWLYKADPYLSLVYAEAAVRGGVVSEVRPGSSAGVPDLAKRSAAAAQGGAIAARNCNSPR